MLDHLDNDKLYFHCMFIRIFFNLGHFSHLIYSAYPQTYNKGPKELAENRGKNWSQLYCHSHRVVVLWLSFEGAQIC